MWRITDDINRHFALRIHQHQHHYNHQHSYPGAAAVSLIYNGTNVHL